MLLPNNVFLEEGESETFLNYNINQSSRYEQQSIEQQSVEQQSVEQQSIEIDSFIESMILQRPTVIITPQTMEIESSLFRINNADSTEFNFTLQEKTLILFLFILFNIITIILFVNHYVSFHNFTIFENNSAYGFPFEIFSSITKILRLLAETP